MGAGLIITISVTIGALIIISLLVFFLMRNKGTQQYKNKNYTPKEIQAFNIGGNLSQRSLIIGFRIFIGISATILLILIYIGTQDTIEKASYMGASAIQIIQVYSEGMFNALIITGAALGLYILSRAYLSK